MFGIHMDQSFENQTNIGTAGRKTEQKGQFGI